MGIACDYDHVIVTKDADFGDFSLVWGVPPQISWIRRGNSSSNDIEAVLRNNVETVPGFSNDDSMSVLAL